MNLKRLIVIFLLISLFMLGLWLPVNAAPGLQQQFFTATPGPDGRITYIVQAADSCSRVAILHNISVEQLRQLNSKLDENCTLIEGQELLISIVSVEGTPTAGPSPTPAAPTASPTPFTGTTEICVLLFEDTNGDSLHEPDVEPAIAGGAISVTEINGEYSASQDTVIPADPTVYQGMCFSDVPEGTYNISVAIPDNYNATVEMDYSLEVNAGDLASVSFGAQRQDEGLDPGEPGTTDDPDQLPWLGILGGFFLLGGAGLGYFAYRANKPESKLAGRGGGFFNR
jgi:hypothetical protein